MRPSQQKRFLWDSLKTTGPDDPKDPVHDTVMLYINALLGKKPTLRMGLKPEFLAQRCRILGGNVYLHFVKPYAPSEWTHQNLLDNIKAGVEGSGYMYGSQGRTVIMLVIDMIAGNLSEKEGGDEIAVCLVRGADVRLIDLDGNTALHYAVRRGLPAVVSQLVEAGSDVQARNCNGETPHEFASIKRIQRGQEGTGETRYGRIHRAFVRLLDAVQESTGGEFRASDGLSYSGPS
ncbi:hypothetical protein QBC35DRAFT_502900 [Podospora australis]|uniref:Ankyrin repeat protein n=1 Tax=Podospora australis TaxID=1536484 RepID=A0AAN7AGJ5_9PEZI|nr:hypothetical protein QBC35DRAFT_502900 [Podospora australis]